MSGDPHRDPSTQKPKAEKVSTIRCGTCIKKIEAPPLQLERAYDEHQLECRRPS